MNRDNDALADPRLSIVFENCVRSPGATVFGVVRYARSIIRPDVRLTVVRIWNSFLHPLEPHRGEHRWSVPPKPAKAGIARTATSRAKSINTAYGRSAEEAVERRPDTLRSVCFARSALGFNSGGTVSRQTLEPQHTFSESSALAVRIN